METGVCLDFDKETREYSTVIREPRDLERDLRYGCLLALASFVMGAAVAGDDAASVETHRRGLRRLAAAALDWGAAVC